MSPPAALVVTTRGAPSPALRARARAFASQWSLPYVERRHKDPLGALLGTRAQALLAFGGEGVTLVDAGGAYRWSPGIAALRIKCFEKGEPDTLVRMAALGPGESVLDCTLGFAQDALVAARAVGPSGRVVGIEKSFPLWAVVSQGLASFDPGPASCRVEARFGDAAEVLAALPPDHFDVVLFDPMFGRPQKAQPAFELLRRHAEHAPLTVEGVQAALRVARRAVVVKASRYSQDLKRLGLRPLPVRRPLPVAWARIDKARA